jgi:hypothetical protein
MIGAISILAPLLVYADTAPVVARVGVVEIRADEIACADVCQEESQRQLTRRIVTLVAGEALALAGIRPDRHEQEEMQRRLPPHESIRAMSETHRTIARAAIQALRDGDIQRAYEEHLQPQAIPMSMLERFLSITGSVEGATEFLTRDLESSIREDLQKQIAAEWRIRRIRAHIEQLYNTDAHAADRFWSEVLRRERVEVLAADLAVPDVKGVLATHEIQARPIH